MNKNTLILGESWPHTRAKTNLLAATGEVVRVLGPRGATLKNIAKLAEVTEPAIFRHFDGVDGLFDALCQVTTMYISYLINQAKASKNTGLALLEEYFLSKMETLAADREFSAFIGFPEPLFADYPELKKKTASIRAEETKLITSAIKEAKTKGQLLASVDPDFAVLLYSGFEQSVINEWMKNWNSFNPAKEAQKLWKNFRTLIAKSDAPSAQHTPLQAKPYGKANEVEVEKTVKPSAKKATAKTAKPALKTAAKAKAASKTSAKKPAKPAAKTTKPAKKPAPAKKK
ncbi:MAG TPA: TetR/AcrR family transcriptional regulator [Spirochaetales bacterium]|nr:TetR/AcrR family transcriptional regulator [Spirochaetales bacterium]